MVMIIMIMIMIFMMIIINTIITTTIITIIITIINWWAGERADCRGLWRRLRQRLYHALRDYTVILYHFMTNYHYQLSCTTALQCKVIIDNIIIIYHQSPPSHDFITICDCDSSSKHSQHHFLTNHHHLWSNHHPPVLPSMIQNLCSYLRTRR